MGEAGRGGPGAGPPIRVLICDDQEVFRRGLALILEPEPDLEVVAEAEDGRQAVDLARRAEPDVVLLDVRLPVMGGLEAAQRLRFELPRTRVVMLTASDSEDDLYEAVRAGAAGYLLKDTSVDDIGDAIRTVAAGVSVMSPTMLTKLLTEFTVLAHRVEGGRALAPGPQLTPREIEVLGHVARGRGNRAIAEELFISENTVKNHVRNILDKLKVHSRTEAALLAVREDLIHIDT